MSKHRTKNNMYVRSIQSTLNRIINILVGLCVLSIGVFIFWINNMAMRMTQMTMEKALFDAEWTILVLIFSSYFAVQKIFRLSKPTGQENLPVIAKYVYHLRNISWICVFEFPLISATISGLADQGIFQEWVTGALGSPLILFLPVAGYTTWIYRRLCMKKASDILKVDTRPPIVFLRSFHEEKVIFSSKFLRKRELWRSFSWQSVTLEWVLSDVISDIGPFIALGNPDKKIPPEGAARDMISIDWQKCIIDYINRAAIVIITVGETEGLNWEIDWIIKHNMLKKTIFIMPPFKEKDRINKWEALIRRLKLKNPLNQSFNSFQFFCLMETDNPIIIKVDHFNEKSYREGFKQLLNNLLLIKPELHSKQEQPKIIHEKKDNLDSLRTFRNIIIKKPEFVYYTPEQIGASALLGGVLAGASLFTINNHRLGQKTLAHVILSLGLVGMLLQFIIAYNVPLYVLVPIEGIFSISLMIGADIARQRASDIYKSKNQSIASWWVVFGFTLLFMLFRAVISLLISNYII